MLYVFSCIIKKEIYFLATRINADLHHKRSIILCVGRELISPFLDSFRIGQGCNSNFT